MYHHDDDLDRALLALPLEPLPEGLRTSILAAVSMVPRPMLTRWETAGIGVILALATWLSLLLVNGGVSAGPWLSSSAALLGRFVTSPTTLVWVAAGMAAALCLSLVSIPRRAPARS
jgi:hypothetical protein